MSRTYKDKPWKFKNPEAYDYNWGCEKIPYEKEYTHYRSGEVFNITSYWVKPIAGAKTKKRKTVDCDWHWMSSTPSWWTRMMMNRPQRREVHLWEHTATHTPLDELEELDTPPSGKKPHIYYW